MAGFRGVVPTQETIDQILANLVRARKGLGQHALATADPFVSRAPQKGAGSLHDQVSLNDVLGQIFLGLKTGEVVPNE